MKIGIDLDETTLNLIDPLIEYHKEKTGKKLEREDFESFYLSDILSISKEEEWIYLDEFYNSDYFDKILPLQNSINVLKELSKNHEIFFITARPENWREKTEKWLSKFVDFPHKLILTSNMHKNEPGKKKFEVCEEKSIDIFIEDDHNYALGCANVGVKTFLLNKPWNRKINHKNITRVDNWNEIHGILKNNF